MSRYVFQLVQLIDYRLENSQGQSGEVKCEVKLEMAVLSFFSAFKRVYLMDGMSAGGMMPISISSLSLPSASSEHPLLAAALSGLDIPSPQTMTVRDWTDKHYIICYCYCVSN